MISLSKILEKGKYGKEHVHKKYLTRRVISPVVSEIRVGI
jgi:hypothetical protein